MEIIKTNSLLFQNMMLRLEKLESRFLSLIQKQARGNWLTEKEVVALLRISPDTIRRYRGNRWIAYSKIGTKFFYRREDLQTFLNRFRVEADGR